jgi:hypothetical protein
MSPEVAPPSPLRDSRDRCRIDAVFPSHVGTLASSCPVGPDGAYLPIGQACVAVRASSSALRRESEVATLYAVTHILGRSPESQVPDIDASMTARTSIAGVHHEEISGVPVSHNPDHASGAHGFPLKPSPNCGAAASRCQSDALIRRGLGRGHKLSPAAAPRTGAPDGTARGISPRAPSGPRGARLAPGGAPVARGGAGLSARENDAAGCTLGHVVPLSQVRPRPRVVSATAGALLYGQCSSGTAHAADRSGGVN